MQYRIPKTLDNPMRALGIPIDTLLVFMGTWSAFVAFDKGLYGIVTGIFVASVFGRFRSRSVIRKIIRFIYWYLPHEANFIKGLKGHERRVECS